MDKVTELKNRGNEALNQNNFDEAIAAYSEAILLDDKNHVLYSNRSAAYAKASNFELALQDAEKTIELNPTWPKGYSRKGAALTGLKRYTEALAACDEGLLLDPQNVGLIQGREDNELYCMEGIIQDGGMDFTSLHKMLNKQRENQPNSAPAKKQEPEKPKEPTYEQLSEDDKKKFNARLAKEEGNAAYKKKDFENALLNYNKAVEFDPTDITFYNNIAAVYFEQKNYEKCIKECEKAIEIGRENRADFKLIAKALSRIGNVHRKQENWKMAKTFYEKSMSEHRTPEVKTLLSDVEKKIKEEEKKAYIDPNRAEEEKEQGNMYFKKGDYSNAIKHYSEAIKRNPEDPKLYSNRAACYTKLAAFDLGLKDCDMCIKLDRTFIKGYIRKGKILQGMQQPTKASTAYQKALEIDVNNAEALEGFRQCSMAFQNNPKEVWKNAMADPEIQQIFKDPAMRLILDQMQSDPNAVKDHLQNPEISGKITKLIEAGIIQIH